MICEKCKECWNYMVSEVGCYGNIQTCEHFHSDNQDEFSRGEDMDIKLNRAYASHWDNIQYPIFELADGSYLCISYSSNHKYYHINIYTKEEFVEQGFHEDDECDELFENLSREDLNL